MDAREQKARQIVAAGTISSGNGYWLVHSQSGATRYKVTVDGFFPTCTCDDHELTDKPCKHIIAVQLYLEELATEGRDRSAVREPPPKPKRPTYKQDWPNYNLSQTREKDHLQELLGDLCLTIPEPERKKSRGRPPIPLRDSTFAAIFKVYSTFSARRFSCDLAEAQARGHLSCLPHFNSVLNALENPELTPILNDLIRLSALPLAEVEHDFAVDSSGFCTSRFIRWFDVKYGAERQEAEWVKAHICTGVKTNVVTAVTILEKRAGDSPQFPGLVRETATGFRIHEVSADAAYTGVANFQAVEDVGGTLYAAFKKNTTGGVGGIFEKSFHYFCLHREEFLGHYHKRSNIESTFSMVKRKHGDSVRSKTDVAMKNEVLAKFVCHNLCCLISAWYELGIAPALGCTKNEEPAHIIRFLGR